MSVPAVIRSSADWQEKKKKKKHRRRKSTENGSKTCHHHHGVDVVDGSSSSSAATCVDFQDVCCGPGIGFSADAAAAATSVDCVVARTNVSSRAKVDVVERVTHREVFFAQ